MRWLRWGLPALLISAVTMAAPLPAAASLYSWVLDGGVWTGLTGSGTLQTGAADGGGFDVTSFSGIIDGLPVGFSGGNPGHSVVSPSGAFNYDNIIDPASPGALLDAHGLLVSIAGEEGNIWGNGVAGSYSYWRGSGATYEYSNSSVSFTLAAQVSGGHGGGDYPTLIPEPGSLVMFVAALTALEAVRRRIMRGPRSPSPPAR